MRGRISIRGARENNLKEISLEIPRRSLVVVTGPSGSGKSSLAFDTLYAEGQRRYVETLSAYARQFLGELPRPDVDSIEGLSPSISIDQRRAGTTRRSTVGTITEVHDFMRLLWARCGTPHCPACGVPIEAMPPDRIVERLLETRGGEKVSVLAPLVEDRKGEHRDVLERIRKAGPSRARIDGVYADLAAPPRLAKTRRHSIAAVVDRLVVRPEARARLAEAVEAAASLSGGAVTVAREGEPDDLFSTTLGCPRCGRGVPDLHPRRFSFNSPFGACPRCSGLGVAEGFAEETVVDAAAPLGRAILPFGPRDRFAAGLLRAAARGLGLDTRRRWRDLPAEARRVLLEGGPIDGHDFPGFLKILEDRLRRGGEAARRALGPYLVETACPACGGARLRPEALAVRLGGRSIAEVAALEVRAAAAFFAGLDESLARGGGARARIAAPILREIRPRLDFLDEVGLGYLSLDRPAPTLSGGEAQRVRLAAALGAGLSGVLYVLDEPTVGLHPRDTDRLLAALRALVERGNTVVVVEHDERTMRAADVIVDLGPGAGASGGEVLYAGPPAGIVEPGAAPRSATAEFLAGRRRVEVARRPRRDLGRLRLVGARGRNLRGVDLVVPFGAITCVAGVSGSGKSSLVGETLVPAAARAAGQESAPPLPYERLEGADRLARVVEVTQAPIGRTPRSNPATYVGIFGPIRSLFAATPEARMRGWGPGRFSFNVAGRESGRCARCEGDGSIKVEMAFLPDVFVRCSACGGARYAPETLEIRWKGRSIADVLAMTVDEAFAFFAPVPAIAARLRLLADVGLGYLRLGQSATTLSGGEAQRVKLAAELARGAGARAEPPAGATLYVLDEPTTGLHFAEVERLVAILARFADRGDAVVVVEHHPDVVAAADLLVELGPGAGAEGGRIVRVEDRREARRLDSVA